MAWTARGLRLETSLGPGEGATALEVGAVAEEILAEDARRWCFLQVSVTGRNGQDLRLAPAPPRCPR